ncbi:MAG: hypothetical protein Fur0023_05320 [Bacteroidia bacterium]
MRMQSLNIKFLMLFVIPTIFFIEKIHASKNISEEDTLKYCYHNKINIVGARVSNTFYRIPYKGFFKNEDLFNMWSKAVQVHYLSNFYGSQRWFYGVMFGYDWYQLKFYDLTGSYDDMLSHSNDWNKQKYSGAKHLNDVINGFNFPLGLQDSMLMYYGEKVYAFEYFRIGYMLGYITKIGKRWSAKFFVETSGLIPREISRLNKGQGGYDGSIDWQGSELLGLTPFNFFVNLFERFNDINRQNGLVQYSIGLEYAVKHHTVGINFSWANWFFTYDLKNKPYYAEYSNHPMCLGCPPVNANGYTPGYIYVPVLPNTYRRISISVEYNYIFTKTKKHEKTDEM